MEEEGRNRAAEREVKRWRGWKRERRGAVSSNALGSLRGRLTDLGLCFLKWPAELAVDLAAVLAEAMRGVEEVASG